MKNLERKKILVFPCGSEIGLEVYRSLKHSTHVELFGASSVDDHGKFVFERYIGNLPFLDDECFIPNLTKIVEENRIDAIFPAMDSVITKLKENEETLKCKIIASETKTTAICLSKNRTYSFLSGLVATPKLFETLNEVNKYPVFLKPDIGYGSRGTLKAENNKSALSHLSKYPSCLILEYLPGREYTIDCFTDFKGNLLFIGPRERKRISNGISVNTKTMQLSEEFEKMANVINDSIKINGAWFFQAKERITGELVLMEVASRLGGSSSVYRAKGVNFAALSIYNAFEMPVSIMTNEFDVELDRALDTIFNIDINFNYVYVDFDDTIVINGYVNSDMVARIYKFLNEGKIIYLLTRHEGDIYEALEKYRLSNLFDEVIHIKNGEDKWRFIKHRNSIFIDDSFAERREIHQKLAIPVFGLDVINVKFGSL